MTEPVLTVNGVFTETTIRVKEGAVKYGAELALKGAKRLGGYSVRAAGSAAKAGLNALLAAPGNAKDAVKLTSRGVAKLIEYVGPTALIGATFAASPITGTVAGASYALYKMGSSEKQAVPAQQKGDQSAPAPSDTSDSEGEPMDTGSDLSAEEKEAAARKLQDSQTPSDNAPERAPQPQGEVVDLTNSSDAIFIDLTGDDDGDQPVRGEEQPVTPATDEEQPSAPVGLSRKEKVKRSLARELQQLQSQVNYDGNKGQSETVTRTSSRTRAQGKRLG